VQHAIRKEPTAQFKSGLLLRRRFEEVKALVDHLGPDNPAPAARRSTTSFAAFQAEPCSRPSRGTGRRASALPASAAGSELTAT